MSFQFLCPQGHLLEGEESQAGQQCDCPMCGTRFVIPGTPTAMPQQPQFPGQAAAPAAFDPGVAQPYQAPQFEAPQHEAPVFEGPQFGPPHSDPFAPAEPAGAMGFPGEGQGAMEEVENPFQQEEEEGPKLLHIPCPKGHELETPEEMLGQDVLCPFCGEQFTLQLRDSVEYKREREMERDRRDRKAGKTWFNWAITMAVVVIIGVVVMLAMIISRS